MQESFFMTVSYSKSSTMRMLHIWGDKNNTVLMNNLQILQNKAAKIVLDRPLPFSSATDVLSTFRLDHSWETYRLYYRCLFVFMCLNNHTSHRFELLANREIHNYNTRYKDNFSPPKVSRNWEKQRLAYQAITDWNNLDRKIKLSIVVFLYLG